jgi:predicted nucleic acid-binding protein
LTLIIDAGGLYAQADADEPQHAEVAAVLRAERGDIVTSQVAAAEADYLILRRLGPDVESAFISDLASGTFIAECLDAAELETVRQVVDRHRDLRLGLADVSLMVLSERYSTTRILTFDRRAFRAVSPLQGGHFTILPADLESSA